jgi:nitrile hydratase subunit beta
MFDAGVHGASQMRAWGDLAAKPDEEEESMNGAHDLGGVQGLGRIKREADEPVFHSSWEKSVFGMLWATFGTGVYNLDEFRHGIERMHPVHYLTSRYYEHWLYTLERNLIAKGYVTAEELAARTRQFLDNPDAPAPRHDNPALAERLAQLASQGASTSRQVDTTPRFRVGDHVVARNSHPTGHTRLARYIRGKRGVIAHVYEAYVFPDTNAHGRGEQAQYVYRVRFEGRELWGDTAEPNQVVYVDLWESYLQPA